MRVVGRPHLKNEGGISVIKKKEETDSLAHTKWNCKYHIVFAPKYRRQVIYGQIRSDFGVIIRKLCEYKGVEIIEAEACPDHIHMLVSIPPKYSVSQFMGYLKGKSSLMIFDRHANLKYKYGNRQFWCKGYYVDTVGRNISEISTRKTKYATSSQSKNILTRLRVSRLIRASKSSPTWWGRS